MDDLCVGYQLPPLLEDISLTLRYGQRVALIGPNGSGKTTLLRTITDQIAPLEGTFRVGANVKIGVMAQDQDTLIPAENALEAIQNIHGWNDTEARSFLSKFLFTDDAVFTSAELMSFGERARLMLAQLVAQGTNLLLLDEPINHMDIASRVHSRKPSKNMRAPFWLLCMTGILSTTSPTKSGRSGIRELMCYRANISPSPVIAKERSVRLRQSSFYFRLATNTQPSPAGADLCVCL